MTYSQVSSPQPLILSRVASEYKVPKIVIGVGGPTSKEKVIERHNMLRKSSQLGSDLRVIAKLGYNTVLKKHADRIAEEENLFLLSFGLNVEDYIEELVMSTADQVRNLPDLENLVVPVGSGIMFAGIVCGLKRYNKKVKNVFGIQIAGVDRSGDIDRIVEKSEGFKVFGEGRVRDGVDYHLIKDKTFPYSKSVKFDIAGLDLDVIYEAKAYTFLVRHRGELGIKDSDDSLFWIIGNQNAVRFG